LAVRIAHSAGREEIIAAGAALATKRLREIATVEKPPSFRAPDVASYAASMQCFAHLVV